MSETTRSYEHPGITDPVAEERPRGTGAFASLAPVTAPAGNGAAANTIDLAKELTEAGVEDVLTELDDGLVGLVPVKTRIREIAGAAFGGTRAAQGGACE